MVELQTRGEVRHPGLEIIRLLALTHNPKNGGKPYLMTDIAELLGVSRQTLYQLINGKMRTTPNMVARLGKLFGYGPRPWLTLQLYYDLQEANKFDVSNIETIPLHMERDSG